MPLSPRYDWQTVAVPDLTGHVAETLGLPRPAMQLLAARGITTADELDRFLAPSLATLSDPFDFPNMLAAAERIWLAIDRNEPITIFGDFDADGIAATAILADALALLGATVHPFLPHRLSEGYGVTPAALTRCIAEFPDTRLLITVDCGITAAVPLRQLPPHIDVIITDHHHLPDEFPRAIAIVHPLLPGVPDAAQRLCGAGVAFKLVHALVKLGRQQNRPQAELDPRCWLDAAAVATIADVVPLLGENRILVSAGLQRLARAPSTGLATLLLSAGLTRPPGVQDIAFRIAPRINASGRLDTAHDALALLRTNDPDHARDLAQTLHQLNEDRRTLEHDLFHDILNQLRAEPPLPGATVIAHPDWHPGLLGLLAARLSEHVQQPAAVIALIAPDRGRGSLRADARFDLMAALHDVASCLDGFGGHARAAGITLHPDKIPEFRQRFADACRAQSGAAASRPHLRIDAWLEPADINDALFNAIRRFEPFGEGHETPRWALANLALREPPRVIGADGSHLALTFACGARPVRAVWFRAGHLADEIRAAGNSFDVVFELTQNVFLNQTNLEFRILDLRSSHDFTHTFA